MPLFESLPVDEGAVAAAVAARWGLTLGARLKASQNTTWAAVHPASGARFAVRATPDPTGEHARRVADEVALTRWLVESGGLVGRVCAPVWPAAEAAGGDATSHAAEGVVVAGGAVLCVYEWAGGAPVDFLAYRWMTDRRVALAWGAWLAAAHAAGRAYSAAHPQASARVRRWDALHGGLMAGVRLHPDDAAAQAAAEASPARVGPGFILTHGDVNVSNFHLLKAGSADGSSGAVDLCVFDWDQAQRAWPEYDLAQAALAARMLQEAGSLPAGDPVPAADHARLLAWLVEGYEGVAGAGAVDAPRLHRMCDLRKAFYAAFAARAAAEGGVPPEMAFFLDYVGRWTTGAAATAGAGAEAAPPQPAAPDGSSSS
jgi:hypothetical protein